MKRSQPEKVLGLLHRGISKGEDLEAVVGFPEQRPMWLEYGEQGREWQEMRGGQKQGQVEPIGLGRAWILFRAPAGWSVILKVKLGSNSVKRDPPGNSKQCS